MNVLYDVFGNHILKVSVLAWLAAQILKTLFHLIATKKFNKERLVGAGGMPSSHSALVCALTVSMARVEGVNSPLFALAFLFAAVVMYDAMGVRRAAGEQAKVLNRLLDEWEKARELENIPDDADEEELDVAEKITLLSLLRSKRNAMKEDDVELKEYLGHTPMEVLAGALLGILIAMVVPR
ncbi:MAG: divergent PAP2 family protein [Clostridiales bacterium]|nr:divergent PAP2 family protein [Clostridiales bacterium]